jgi:hypothetical protein
VPALEVPALAGWDSFLWTLSISTFGDSCQEIKLEGHHSHAVYRPDVSLGLTWPLTAQESFTEPWRDDFPDRTASSQYADVLWNDMLIDRFFMWLWTVAGHPHARPSVG